METIDVVKIEGLDPGISDVVTILRTAGVGTYESCEGGEEHSYPEPTVRFYGERSEGFRAFAVAMENGLMVRSIRRIWEVIDGEPTGPDWELTFWRRYPPEADNERD